MTPAPTRLTSVLDEAHDFQRFEHVTLNLIGGRTSRRLLIVCRCGWSSISIEDPDAEATVAAVRDLLGRHVDDALARAKNRAGKKEP